MRMSLGQAGQRRQRGRLEGRQRDRLAFFGREGPRSRLPEWGADVAFRSPLVRGFSIHEPCVSVSTSRFIRPPPYRPSP